MKVNAVNQLKNLFADNPVVKQNKKEFDNILTNFVGKVNDSQLNAGKLVNDFIDGKDVQLHEVMIAGEKAKTNFDLLMEIRNKTLDMYKELTRMQI